MPLDKQGTLAKGKAARQSPLQDALDRIAALEQVVAKFTTKEIKMTKELDEMIVQVANTVGVGKSTIVAVQLLSARLDAAIAAANNGDTAALPALSASLKANADALAAAIANLPVDPAAPAVTAVP